MDNKMSTPAEMTTANVSTDGRRFLRNPLLAAALALLLLAGCAGTGPKHAERTATSRAMERAAEVIAGNGEAAWLYFSPGYRAAKSRDIFVRDLPSRPVKWLSVEHLGEDCNEQGDRCTVILKVAYQLQAYIPRIGQMESTQVIRETWLKIKGEWYLVPREMSS
jgi:hypothetical protein